LLFAVSLHADSPDVSDPQSKTEGSPVKQDPLLAERDAVRAEIRRMDEEIAGVHGREREARQALRAAAGERKNYLDPANVDEETAELIVRARKLEEELQALKVQITARLKVHPEIIAREKRVQAVNENMQALREERTEIQKRKVEKVGRLRMIDKALVERQKAAQAESEAKAAADSDPENDDAMEAVGNAQ